jgi:hypothetical protein
MSLVAPILIRPVRPASGDFYHEFVIGVSGV